MSCDERKFYPRLGSGCIGVLIIGLFFFLGLEERQYYSTLQAVPVSLVGIALDSWW